MLLQTSSYKRTMKLLENLITFSTHCIPSLQSVFSSLPLQPTFVRCSCPDFFTIMFAANVIRTIVATFMFALIAMSASAVPLAKRTSTGDGEFNQSLVNSFEDPLIYSFCSHLLYPRNWGMRYHKYPHRHDCCRLC